MEVNKESQKREGCSLAGLCRSLRVNILEDFKDCLLISIPGILYTIQNNLIYIGYSYLSAVAFQMTYQLKIFTTAIFFRLILGRKLNTHQWLSLLLLFIGVVINQSDDFSASPNPADSYPISLKLLALGSITSACICSGFAGVYFEKLLKGSHKSIAIRNIQLAFYGLSAGIVVVWFKDGTAVREKGLFFGYDYVVWAAVLIQSLGGLLIAATISYADNILKGFATSIAIVLTFFLSVVFFDYSASLVSTLGAILVVASTMLYSYSSVPPKEISCKTQA